MPSASRFSMAAVVARSKKPRFIPAELAFQLARKMQARRLGTVSVL